MNEDVLSLARELCLTSEYLFEIAIEMAEKELGKGLYEEEINEKKGYKKNDRRDAVLQTADIRGEKN
mgnify:CR=1 FL=1